MKFYIILILLTTHLPLSASYKITWVHYNGTIYLQNNDSLRGDVLLYAVLNNGLLFKTNYIGFTAKLQTSLTVDNKVSWIKFEKIKEVKIDLPGQLVNVVYEFLSYKRTIWRLLSKKDSVSIYSDMIMPGWGLQNAPKRIILVTGKKTYNMYSGLNWFFHNSKTKPLLKSFINRRYNTSFKKTDFKDEDDELNYIVAHG
jgi:hypothetical protein